MYLCLRLSVISLLLALDLAAQTNNVAQCLGYPADAKLLILHADDLAVAHSVNTASFDLLNSGAVSSAKHHPDADLGLHLTLTSEWKTYRWGSVASIDKVGSLLESDGTFYSTTEEVAANAYPVDAEREIRAQIERATAVGIHPTHLDRHMGSLFSKARIHCGYIKVAHDFKLLFSP